MHPNLSQSWERSKRYNANLAKAKEAILQAHELKEYIEHQEDLLQLIRPMIDPFAYSLKSAGSIVAISNSSGLILESRGDPSFLQETEKIYLRNGADWSEEIRGTNSAGTVAIEKRPLAVIGKDHYLSSHHMLYCVGSPIFDPHGNLRAVLNSSGHEHLYHPSMLGMVDTIARNIEDRLLIQQRNPQMILSLSTQPSKHDEALLAVDQHGQIIGTNREARELLLLENIIDKAIYLEELFSNTEPLFQHQQTTTQSIPLHMKGSEEKQLSASIILNTIPPKIFVTDRSTNKKQIPTMNQCSHDPFAHIYGEDELFNQALATARKAAQTPYTVMITGETGTGKEMVSQAIHEASPRSAKPFIALNCGGITKSLAESELFGYEGGAFTGAKRSGQPGVFEQADGGTLFLDEIAELPMDIQISLLRVLQDYHIMRIGGTTSIPVDVRIITATHTDLWEKVQNGTFRADLFYRLQGIHVHLPALRNRQDRLPFAKMILKQVEKELHKQTLSFSTNAEQFIEEYTWPGNVRQLMSAIREAAFSSTNHLIDVHSFPDYILTDAQQMKRTGSLLQDTENKLILQTMKQTGGNMTKTAQILGIGRNTLYRKLDRLKNKPTLQD